MIRSDCVSMLAINARRSSANWSRSAESVSALAAGGGALSGIDSTTSSDTGLNDVCSVLRRS